MTPQEWQEHFIASEAASGFFGARTRSRAAIRNEIRRAYPSNDDVPVEFRAELEARATLTDGATGIGLFTAVWIIVWAYRIWQLLRELRNN